MLDTNVLISAALFRLGKPFACLDWVLDNATLIVSRELLEELETRLARPKFGKYVDDARRREFVVDLGLTAVQVELSGVVTACRDPDDNKLLEIAIAGRAGSRSGGLPSSQGRGKMVPVRGVHRAIFGVTAGLDRPCLRSPSMPPFPAKEIPKLIQ